MNVARYMASATVLNGYIYIAGGWAGGEQATSSVELYDPKTDEWFRVTPMSLARGDFVLAETKGFLYALGQDKVVERFDPWKNCWSKVCEVNGPTEKSEHKLN